MKILLDTCVWHGVRDALMAAHHNVIWSGDWDADPGDEDILAIALQQERILVTLDKDFGALAILHKSPMRESFGWSTSQSANKSSSACMCS